MLLVGTAKGLLCLNDAGKIEREQFSGLPISMVFEDARTGTWWVGLSHRHWGQKLYRSADQGENWREIPCPTYPGYAEVRPGQRAKLKQIWCMAEGGTDHPNRLWMGTEPGGLFLSEDGGDSFQLVESLWNHPSRSKETQWFGAGKDFPFIHSIEVDPRDSQHVYIAVSCAGIFETKDGGQSWNPKNKGLIAAYLPNPRVEVGHDPHNLQICHSTPEVMWQQNHCGIFRTENGGAIWENVTDTEGLADYGFCLAIDPDDPLIAWVIPADSDESRVPPELALVVCKTEDGGKTWTPKRQGLPQNHCYDIVFRQSLALKHSTLAFGTTNGNLYVSVDKGESWECMYSHLARVACVVFTQ